MARTGRPVEIGSNHECWKDIFTKIGDGLTIRKAIDGLMNPSTFYDYIDTYPDLSEKYARAREKKARILLDDIEDIANDRSEDTFIDEKGVTRINNAAVQRDRLRVGAIQWRAEKELSSEYGQRIDVNQTVNITLRDQLQLSKEKVINPKLPVQKLTNSESDSALDCAIIDQQVKTPIESDTYND